MASRRLDISSLLCNDEPQVSPLDALVQAATEERKRLHEPLDEQPRYLQQPQPQPQQRPREDYVVHDRRRQQEDRQSELFRLQEQERRAQQEMLLQQQQQILLQRRRREEEQHRALEYERQVERDHIEAQRRQVHDEQQRRDAAERELERQHFLQQQQQQQRERAQYRFPPSPVAAHPASISHLISHSPPIRHSNTSISSLGDFDHLDGDDRPVKKRRYSNSPTRHEDYQQQHQQQERLVRERERMRVGELGYGRVVEPLSQSPVAGPSSSSSTPTTSTGPRRPGSGHTGPRKVAVADLLVDREPLQPPAVGPPPFDDNRRIISPVGGNRRSPPGSQAGRAKAARKSDEYIASRQHQVVPILPNEDPVKPSRSRQLSDEARSSSGDDQPRPQQHHPPLPPTHPPVAPPRQRKTQAQTLVHSHPPATVHPSLLPPPSFSGSSSSPVTTTTATGPFAPKLSTSTSSASPAIPSAASRSRQGGQAQQDPHEWFLHQYDEEPSPTNAAKPPPHTPSPSSSPTAGILVPGAVSSSTLGMSAAAMGALGISQSATTSIPHVPHSQAKSKSKSQSKSKSPPVASSHPHSHNKILGGLATSTVTAADSLDKELEDLVSESKPSTPIAPTPSSVPLSASTSTNNKPVKPPKQTKPRKPKKQPKEETKDDMDLALDQAMNELVEDMEDDEHEHDAGVKRELGVDTSMGMEVDVEDELLSLVDDRPPPPLPMSSASSHPQPLPPLLAVPSSAGGRRLSAPLAPATSHGSLTPTQPAQGVAPTRLSPIPPPQQQHKRSASEAPQARSSPIIPSPIVTMTGPSNSSASGKPNSTSAAMSVARSTSDRESMPPPASTSGLTITKADRAGSVVTPDPGSASTSAVSVTATAHQTGAKKKKESAAKGTGAKAKAAAAKAEKAEKEKAEKEKAEKDGTTTTAKPKGKGGARSKKDKVAAAAAESLAASINAAVGSGPTPPAPPAAKPTKGGRKASGTAAAAVSSSRSRSTSVMRGATPAQDSDAGKVDEKDKEGGAEEDEEPEDDNKLYCLCKTKYDEGRFMIACDRCDEWYHTQCVNMPDLEVDLVDQFICPSCVEKNPHLNLQTTYKTRCLYGLKHPDPDSPKACHKAARGAFSKYCSEECGVKYMQSRIDTWAKKGGKTEKLWETVKSAEKREGVVVCKVEVDDENKDKMDVDEAVNGDEKPAKPTTTKHKVIPPSKTKVAHERERLDLLLASLVSKREEMQRGIELIVCRERLLQLASERAELVGQCGWDQRLCCDDDELGEMGSAVWETYEESEKRREKEDVQGGDPEANGDQEAESMDVDGNEEQWWCPGKKVCDRHSGWQTIRYKEVSKEKEMKEEALAKLITREREIRKRIEDLLDPQGANAADANTNGKNGAAGKESGGAPLKSSNAKLLNGHSKSKAAAGEKKGKKRKAPTS